jgi:hypothetical protein
MSYFLRSTLTVLLLANLLAACAKDPGAAFFALESELIDKVEPHGTDSEAARAALCKWFREEGPRIRETHKVYEDYLERLAASYSQFFYRYEAAPVLIVNTDNLNFADEPADFELLVRCINDMRGPREFISRGGA